VGNFDHVSGLNAFLNPINNVNNENVIVCFTSPLMAKM
jgi:hypothetical protein